MRKEKFKESNIEPYWDLIKRIIEESDLVLEILDARLIELSRNEEVEKLIKEVGRPVIFVINKMDLVSKQKIKKQIKKLKDKGEVVFISSKNKYNKKILLSSIKKIFKRHGKSEEINPLKRKTKAEIVVGVLGYPNVGKSSVINLLSPKKKAIVSKKAGTTHGIHWIKATNEIKLIDSPGVIPLKEEDEIRYSLIGARNPEKIKNPEFIAENIIKLFQKNSESFYNVLIENKTSEEILKEISLKRRHLLKGDELDLDRTSKMIIRDWQQGKIRL